MAKKLGLDYSDIKRLVEWSFFIETGNIHAQKGTSSIDNMELELSKRLSLVFNKMIKMKKTNTEKDYGITQQDCEILQNWFRKLPSSLIDPDDGDLHCKLSLFMCKSDI